MEMVYLMEGIDDAAAWFWSTAGGSKVFVFHGEMGAGKTTFIQALCRHLGVRDVMGSPSFPIINEYRFMQDGKEKRVFHMDLYRLSSADEAIQAGVEDALYGDDLCLVEWPEKAPGIFPAETADVYLTIIDSAARKLQIGRN